MSVSKGGEIKSRALENSPQRYARIGGVIYVVIIMLALFGLYSREGLIVPDAAASTADNIVGSEMLFLAGLAGEMLSILGDVTLTMILYVLLRPVSRSLALLAAFQRLTFNGVYAVSKLFLVATLIVLGDADYLNAFDPQQLHALAYLGLILHAHGYSLSLIFFGFNCLLLGYLIVRSGYLPRIIGVLLVLGGVGYLINSFWEVLLAPAFTASLFPGILLLTAFAGELGLGLWLAVKGVNVPKWEERAQG
jgi:hypothetical protein